MAVENSALGPPESLESEHCAWIYMVPRVGYPRLGGVHHMQCTSVVGWLSKRGRWRKMKDKYRVHADD